MQISVVIPSYNTIDTIPDTLEALEQQNTSCDYEVIVVDCSDDDQVQQTVERTSHGRCLRRETRFLPGEGRNLGAQAALGELLVFLDADVVLESSALQAAWDFYQNGNRMFGGSLELNEKRAVGASSYLEHYFFNHEAQRGRPECERANLSSALMLVDRSLFIAAGGFANIPRMQDMELSERLRAEGLQLKLAPSVTGYQIQDSPMRKVLRKIFINGQNLYAIRYSKHASLLKKLFFLVALPALAGFKVLRIIGRHLRYQTLRQRGITLLLVPLLALAGIYWMLGFYRSILFGGGISAQR